MLTIGFRYLTGYAAATDLSRDSAEWPPHPARIFMALAAAHFETGSNSGEKLALEWLEAQGPPKISASEAHARTVVESYVPVNDDHGGVVRRSRQLRKFHRTRPHEDSVYLNWEADPPERIQLGLTQLCGKVTRVGHSSSLVQMWVEETSSDSFTWHPDSGRGELRMRIAGPGTLAYLRGAFNKTEREKYAEVSEALGLAKGKAKKQLKVERDQLFPEGEPPWTRPQITTWQSYSRRQEDREGDGITEGPFDPEFIALRKEDGNNLGLESTLQLTGALRNALMKAAGEDVPEWLSGHTVDGGVTRKPHAAFLPLPYAGSEFEHADGHLLGLGIALPRGIAGTADGRRVLGKFLFTEEGETRQIKLWRTGAWEWVVEREARERPPVSMRRRRWTEPSRIWASVTPVVLHHHPKPNRDGDAERIVMEAFLSAQLPMPVRLELRSVSAHRGGGHVMGMPAYQEGGPGQCQHQVHVIAEFNERVEGPVLVGRGRFRGYGLFLPISQWPNGVRKWD